ncbi:MAG: hypothetical protein IPK22_25670 [Verrucomicrobiaceae bacterium]|nr:hypothetical protein [Verrucomicrobiaceae bacterium]
MNYLSSIIFMLLYLGLSQLANARIQEFFADLDSGQKVVFRTQSPELPARLGLYSFSIFRGPEQKEIRLFEMDNPARESQGTTISYSASYLGSAYVEGDRVSILVFEVLSGMHLISKRIEEGLAGSTEMTRFRGELGVYEGKTIRLTGLHTIEIRDQDDPPDAKPKILSMNEGPDWYLNYRGMPTWSLDGQPCPQVRTGIARYVRNQDGTTELLQAPELKYAADFIPNSETEKGALRPDVPRVSPAPAPLKADPTKMEADTLEKDRLPIFIILFVFAMMILLVWQLKKMR